jgi:hypothetical protein
VYSDVVTVSGNSTYSTATGTNPGGYAPSVAGTYQWLAVYSGDVNNKPAGTAFGDIPEVVGRAAQTVTFTSSPPHPALVGGSYAPTATGGDSGNPVVFSIDASSSAGACWMLGGTVLFTGSGTCLLDANQAGNTNFAQAPQGQQSISIGFTRTVSGNTGAPLTVASGQAVLLSAGTIVGGSVTVQAGGSLTAQSATIRGSLTSSGAALLRLCQSAVSGPVSVTRSTGIVVIGDDDGATACAGNTIAGQVSITGNLRGVEFDGNTVRDSLTITGNTGTLPPPDTGSVDASSNRVRGRILVQ